MREDDQDSDGSPPPPLDPAGAHGSSSAAPFSHDLGTGDVVLILDLPDVFTVGYDSVTLTAREFLGFRDVPPGPHFFWVAQPGAVSTRSGCWIVATGTGNRVHVLQWDRESEGLVEPNQEKARSQSEDIASVYTALMPYSNPFAYRPANSETPTSDIVADKLRVWEQLSGFVTEDGLVRMCGRSDCGTYFVHTTDMATGANVPEGEQLLNKRLAVSAAHFQSRELQFTFPQDEQTYTTRNTGRDRTLDATDATSYIYAVLERGSMELDMALLGGELQFAYVSGMHLGNDACIHQWWYMLVKLVLKAYLLPERHPDLASALLRTVAAQLSYSFERLEESFLEYVSEAKRRELRLALTVYKRRLDELVEAAPTPGAAAPEHLAVATAFAKVEAVVTAHLDWDLGGSYVRKGRVVMEDGEEIELELEDLEGEDERGEYAPAFVNLNESGRPDDLVSWS